MEIWKKTLLITWSIISIVILICIAFIIWWTYDNFIFTKSPFYNNAMYSVVIYNETNQEVRDICVSYGEGDNIVEFKRIDKMESQKYYKVNIPTNDLPIPPPYNVSIRIKTDNGAEVLENGYFGTGTGGFDVAVITEDGEDIVLDCLPDNSRIYKQLYRRHLKNQKEETW